MYKTGIWRPEDLHRRKTILGTFRTPAYSLLRTSAPARPEEIARFKAVIRDVRLSSGSCRTTYPGRLAEVDRAVDALAVSVIGRAVAPSWKTSPGRPPGAALTAQN